MIARLRAALTPQVLLLFLALALLAAVFGGGENEMQADGLEGRAAAVLSQVEGAGKVSVVISMRSPGAVGGAALGMQAQTQEQVPCGALAVAQGAGDPFVCAQLTQALCALLGLPPSSVSVIAGGE